MEQVYDIFQAKQENEVVLRKGESRCFPFDAPIVKDKKYRLFVKGETTQFYLWKCEPDTPVNYHLISDSLDGEHANNAQYCLNVSRSKAHEHTWRAYKKMLWPPVLSYLPLVPVGNNWTIGCYACTKNLRFEKGGYVRLSVQVYEKQADINSHSTELPIVVDETIELPEGDFSWGLLEKKIFIDESRTAFVGVWLEGSRYTGEVYIENPFLTSQSGYNVLPDFTMPVPGKEKYLWTGQYLSKKEYPKFFVKLNGQTVFEGEKFERAHRYSEWSVDIPIECLSKKNTLEIGLISSYNGTLPYRIKQLSLIENEGGRVALIATPNAATVEKKANVLIRTEQENTKVEVWTHTNALRVKREWVFEDKGLHVLSFDCLQATHNAEFTILVDGEKKTGCIPQIIERVDDGVLVGSGDMVYIGQNDQDFEEFIEWYFTENIGNFLTFRPTYRFGGGAKSPQPKLWKKYTKLFNDLQSPYVHMLDVRELPGANCNPSKSEIDGEYLLGVQGHEHDGKYVYGGTGASGNIFNEQVLDIYQRIKDEDGLHLIPFHGHDARNYIGNQSYMRDPQVPRDMKAGATALIKKLQEIKGDATRHTGPSVMFKYFKQAGFNWVGAETMYTSQEVNMSFLRGVQKAYDLSTIGVHHAMQWSSSPLDSKEHFRRFRLALYLAYMQGAHHINTEEGFWHMEENFSDFDRFSNACIQHKNQQQDFLKYISTHTRRGKFRTPMGLLHGRYDGWVGFINGNPWGFLDKRYGTAEQSWQLLKTFYPLSQPGEALYFKPCPTNAPVGYYSGTPIGNVDVLPVESGEKAFYDYGALAFMGYNCAENEDFEKLEEYVNQGGKLILTRAHLTNTTWYDDVYNKNLDFDCELPLSFAQSLPCFQKDTYNGREIEVCVNGTQPNEILVKTDNGLPLVCRYKVGKGEVVLFNVKEYPACDAIKSLYEEELRRTMYELIAKERVWAKTGDDVEFAVYEREDGLTEVYFLAVDWYREASLLRKAILRVGDYEYSLALPFGVMLKCVVCGNTAVYATSECGEILSLNEKSMRVQGCGDVEFVVLQNGKVYNKTVNFENEIIQEVSLEYKI